MGSYYNDVVSNIPVHKWVICTKINIEHLMRIRRLYKAKGL